MIATATPIPTREEYERMADEYQATLTIEDYMESTDQARQRGITLASFTLVQARRPEIQHLNELLIQYPTPDGKTGRVVPDNMIVVQAETLDSKKSFNVLRESAGVLVVMEYVSEHNPNKDYGDNFVKYREGVRAGYYLMFDPPKQLLQVYHLADGEYVKLEPDVRGRVAIPEIDIEVAILNRWARFWFEGKLLPLPAELQAELDIERSARETAERAKDAAERDLDLARGQSAAMALEIRRLKEELAKRP